MSYQVRVASYSRYEKFVARFLWNYFTYKGNTCTHVHYNTSLYCDLGHCVTMKITMPDNRTT